MSITPWEVQGESINGSIPKIDYNKIMNQFGCQPISEALIERIEKLTGRPAHILLKRGIFYCHRDFEKILDLYEQGKSFYLYTGRGPSSESMHLGHMIPFYFCKYLQDVFNCFLVIQMTDDEKFLFKEDLTLDDTMKYAFENAKDIISVGFNPEKTFIFTDTQYIKELFPTILKIQKRINFNVAGSVFGFDETTSIGKIGFPATQMAPCFSEVFSQFLGDQKNIPCLVPYAIDQDPYFRLCRDVAVKIGKIKPASICSSFFPALEGLFTKMSSSSSNATIFMTDGPKDISQKINKYAFSGGQPTLELQRQLGADLSIDIPFLYLKFFMEDENELNSIAQKYGKGELLTGEVKAICANVLQKIVAQFQENRKQVTMETIKKFMRLI